MSLFSSVSLILPVPSSITSLTLRLMLFLCGYLCAERVHVFVGLLFGNLPWFTSTGIIKRDDADLMLCYLWAWVTLNCSGCSVFYACACFCLCLCPWSSCPFRRVKRFLEFLSSWYMCTLYFTFHLSCNRRIIRLSFAGAKVFSHHPWFLVITTCINNKWGTFYLYTHIDVYKNGGSESFVNMKPKHPDSCVDAEIWVKCSDLQVNHMRARWEIINFFTINPGQIKFTVYIYLDL